MTKAKETVTTTKRVETEADPDAVKFIYRGPDGETATDQFGYQFRDEKPVPVSDKRAIEKLRGNPYFEEVGKRKARKDEDDENRPAVVDAGVNPEPHEPTGIIYGGSGT